MSRDIFISHCWGKDILNRPNHERAKYLSNLLVNQGYSVWFDEYDLIGNIDNAIIKGINDCKVVIICLTESYCNKINNSVYNNLPNDNCYKEWNYCLFKKKRIIPIIMEPTMSKIFLSQDGIFTERCVYTDKNVFAKMLHDSGMIEKINFEIYCKWFDEFIKEFNNFEFIYIKTDPEIAHNRIIKRNRTGEDIPLEYIKKCHNYHEEWLKETKNVKTLNGNVERNIKDSYTDWILEIMMDK